MTKVEREEFIVKNEYNYRIFKKALYVILIVIFLMLSAILITSLFGINVKGNLQTSGTDITYQFQNDNFYTTSIVDENYTDTYNVRNEQYYTENYKGTYSFDNQNELDDWIKINNPIFTINDTINNHSNVLYYKGTISSQYAYNLFLSSQTTGYIEFWVSRYNLTNQIVLQFISSTNALGTALYFNNVGQLTYRSVSGSFILITTISANIWYHFKLFFNCTASNNRISLWINGINFLNYVECYEDTSNINQFRIATGNGLTGSINLDAIGYSWVSPDYSFEDRDLYSYFDNSEFPYDNWDYYNGGTTFAIFENFQSIEGQYLRLYDDDITDNVELEEYFNQQVVEGSISFYFRAISNDIISSFCQSYIYLQKDATKSIQFWINNTGGYLYYKSTPYEEPIILLDYNTWYKLQIDFNCTSLTLDLYINDEYYGELGIPSGTTYLSRIGFFTQTIYNCYLDIDSIETSWGYNIGDNLLPQKEYLDYLETNAFEFSFEDINDMTDTGDDNPLGWVDIEDGGDDVNIVKQSTNGLVYIQNSDSKTVGLYKDDFELDDEFFEIDINFEIENFNVATDYLQIKIYSDDDTEICRLMERYSGNLYFYNISITDYQLLTDEITDDNAFTVKIYISYEIDIAIIKLYMDDEYLDSYITNLIALDKQGLSKILIQTITSSANSFNSFIDYIAIQGNNSYIPNEYSFTAVSMNDTLNLLHNNLFYFNVNGNCSFGISDSNYIFDTIITPYYYFNNTDYIYNLYNSYDKIWNDAYLISWLYNDYQLNSFKFDGVKLVEGSNEYWLTYINSNLDINEGYFYSTNNRLYFTMITNDSDLEYMMATFNINPIETTNYTIFFSQIKYSSQLYSEFHINFDDSTYTPIGSTTTLKEYNILLSDKVISSFSLLITDNYKNINTSISGYISSIILQYYADYSISIITDSLINMIIPLLIILTPSLAIYTVIKKAEESKKIQVQFAKYIFPIFIIIMAFLTYGMDLFPLYLLITILISGIIMLIDNKNILLLIAAFSWITTGFLVFAGIIPLWVWVLLMIITVVLFILDMIKLKGGSP